MTDYIIQVQHREGGGKDEQGGRGGEEGEGREGVGKKEKCSKGGGRDGQ